MADKTTTQQTDVESTTEKVKKPEEVTTVDDDSKSENGDNAENGDQKENGKQDVEEEEEDENSKNADDTDNVCSIKRKSTGEDLVKEAPAEGATPEKKAKLAEPEAESNGKAEVTA